jgi:hypothetical protein
MRKGEALTRIQAAREVRAGTAVRLYAERSYAALRAVLRAQPTQYYRLPLQDDAYQAFEDHHYLEDLLRAAEGSFARNGVDLHSARLGVAICVPSEVHYDHVGKVSPNVPTAEYELVIVAVP